MKNLAYFRKRRGFTQQELGEKLSISKQLVSAWETGNCGIDPKHADSLRDLLQLTEGEIDSLLSESASLSKRRSHSYTPLKIPVVEDGTVACWNTVYYPINDLTKATAISRIDSILGRRGDFVIKVTDGSWGPGFPTGTLILVRPNVHPVSGDQVIVILEGDKIAYGLFYELEDRFNLHLFYRGDWRNIENGKMQYPDNDHNSKLPGVRAIYQVIQKAGDADLLHAANQRTAQDRG